MENSENPLIMPAKAARHRLFGSVDPLPGTKPTEKTEMTDLQNVRQDFLFALDRVGICRVQHPIDIRSDLEPKQQTSIAPLTLATSLHRHAKGINMSRLTETLEVYRKRGLLADVPTVGAFTRELAERMEQERAEVELSFPWFYERRSPVLQQTGLNHAASTFLEVPSMTSTRILLPLLFPVFLAGSMHQAQPPAETKPAAAPPPVLSSVSAPTKASPAQTPAPSVQTVTDPDNVLVLVNKQHLLPATYKPADLVYPAVPFLFKEKLEKRMMRKEAAAALEQLFAGAKRDGIVLAGVSAFRSYPTQAAVFNQYAQQDGIVKATTYSAVPGASEHQTGLAIDVSGSDGTCAATDCFAATPEAEWIAQHAWEYGFILRYPKGQETVTGYQYEPWHIRYVGLDVAKEITAQHETFEEYVAQHAARDMG